MALMKVSTSACRCSGWVISSLRKRSKEELLKLKTAKQNVASFFREEEQTQQER